MELFMLLLKLNVIIFVLKDMAQFIAEILFTLKTDSKVASLLLNGLTYVLSCTKCLSFWMGLIWTLDPFLAAVTSIAQVLIEKTIEKFGNDR